MEEVEDINLKPRRLAPRMDVFNPDIVIYNPQKNLYNAGDISRNSAVEIGIWNGNLQIVLDKADAENTPVFIMFGVDNCGNHFRRLQSTQFAKWQLSCNMYLSYCMGSWDEANYSREWLLTETYQGILNKDRKYEYHCPEYAIHWKQPNGNTINIGKYTSKDGATPTGLYIEPYVIEEFLSGYFSQYQEIDYSEVIIDKKRKIALYDSGNIDNEISLDATDNFIVGQWYKLNGTEADVQKFFDFAVEAKLPVIVERSASGCVNCGEFHDKVLVQPDVISWFATSGCLLYHEYSGSGWFTSKAQRLSQKLVYSKRYGENWEPGIPVTGVWYDGQLVADLFASFNKQKVIEYYEECLAKVDGWNDDKKSDDIKLKSFSTSTTTSKDAGSESVGLGSDVVLAQTRQEYSDILTDLQKSCSRFYGWNSHYNTGSNLQEIVNTPNGRGDALDLAVGSMEKNCRPLFLVYTKAYNKGSNAFNKTFYNWARAFPTALGNMSKYQTTAFDSSKTQYGFYFLHYQNNADETDANANKAKAFITQFGQITTGYPWYIAYCKYPDGHVYARYGSLYSLNKSMSQIQEVDSTSIYTKWGDAAKEFGTEIAYVYNEKLDDPDIDYKIFYVNFTSGAGASGTVDSIQVTVDNLHDYKGTVRLPTKDQVASKVKKSGYEPVSLKSSSGKSYAFGTQIEVTGSITIEIVWGAAKNDDSSSTSPKKTIKSGKIRSYEKREFPVWYKYGSTGSKTARFSSNISALQVIGEASGGPSRNPATQQLVEVYFNDQTSEIAPSAFMQCQNLAYVDARSIKSVGDYAFYNCKSLTAADFIGAQNKALTHIGDYAFAGSGIRDLVINLQGSVSDSSTNTHCFANCRDLTSVNITNSTYLADHMFDGCSQLQSVTLNNYHSYINNYAFANCTMLTSMTFPQKTYMLPDHLFDGCTNLREVKFAEPSELKYLGEAVFANCPKLTSITLPKSIDTFDYIDSQFLAGSSIDQVTFKGLSDDVFVDVIRKTVNAKYKVGRWYECNEDVMQNAYDLGIPIFVLYSNHATCSYCDTWDEQVYDQPEFAKYIKNSNYYWVEFIAWTNDEVQPLAEQFARACAKCLKYSFNGFNFPAGLYYWRKLDDSGKEIEIKRRLSQRMCNDSRMNTVDKFKNTLDTAFADWEGLTVEERVIKKEITTFGRGEGVKVVYVSSTGKEYVCMNDSIVYVPETRVDHYTTSNFKYGIWYRNIRELRQFADQAHQPLLLEFGSKGCEPCKDFKINTFNNQDFQDAVAAKPCLLAKVEIGDGESFDYPTDTQEFYASHEIGDPKTYIPQLVYYWSKSDGSTYKEIWNYNYRTDPGNANYQTVLAKLDKMLGGYTGDPRYLAPAIVTYLDGKYRYYQSEDGDESGQFFICDKKDIALSSTAQLSIVLSQATMDAGSTLVLNSIAPGDELVLGSLSAQDGAYQYFTVDSKSKYFDLSGVIFTVKDSTVTSLYTFENEIGSNYSSDQEYDDTGFWIKFNDTSTSEAFEAKLESCQGSSTPMLVFERPSTVGATAVFAPVSGGDSQTQTFQIDIEEAKSQNDIEAIVRDAIGGGNALQSISNIDELRSIQTFNTQVKHNAAFLTWAKKKNLVLVDVASSTWSGGAPARVRQFETEVQFHNNTTSDPLPKMLVYHGCSTCTADGSIAVYTRRKVEVDSSKSLSYYTGLIGEYLDELEVN